MPELPENPELSYEEFAQARKAYWQTGAKHFGSNGSSPRLERTSLLRDGSDFMLYSAGPSGVFAVFDDFGGSGWFYLYEARKQQILKSAYVYNRGNVSVVEDVIDIGWAADDSACGLAVWGEFRAFLGISSDVHIEKPVTSAEENGIPSNKWPVGFELYLEKKVE